MAHYRATSGSRRVALSAIASHALKRLRLVTFRESVATKALNQLGKAAFLLELHRIAFTLILDQWLLNLAVLVNFLITFIALWSHS